MLGLGHSFDAWGIFNLLSLFRRLSESRRGEIAIKGCSLIGRCRVGMDAHAVVVVCDVAFLCLPKEQVTKRNAP